MNLKLLITEEIRYCVNVAYLKKIRKAKGCGKLDTSALDNTS